METVITSVILALWRSPCNQGVSCLLCWLKNVLKSLQTLLNFVFTLRRFVADPLKWFISHAQAEGKAGAMPASQEETSNCWMNTVRCPAGWHILWPFGLANNVKCSLAPVCITLTLKTHPLLWKCYKPFGSFFMTKFFSSKWKRDLTLVWKASQLYKVGLLNRCSAIIQKAHFCDLVFTRETCHIIGEFNSFLSPF